MGVASPRGGGWSADLGCSGLLRAADAQKIFRISNKFWKRFGSVVLCGAREKSAQKIKNPRISNI